MPSIAIAISIEDRYGAGGGGPPPVDNTYFRPDGVSLYSRPDGSSIYQRP